MAASFEQTKSDLQRTVREVLRVVMYRRWAFFIPFCLAASVVFVMSHRLPRVYDARTVFERQNPIPLSKLLGHRGQSDPLERMKQSMGHDMLGEEAMVRVAEQLGFLEDLERDEIGALTAASYQQAKGVGQGLKGRFGLKHSVDTKQRTLDLDRVTITGSGDDPEVVVKLVNAVRDNYFEFSRLRLLAALQDASDFYHNEIDAVTKLVEEREAEIGKLQERYPYISNAKPGGVDLAMITFRREELEDKIGRLRREISQQEARLKDMPVYQPLRPSHSMLDPRFIDDDQARESERRRLRALIFQIDNSVMEQRLRYQKLDAHPDIQTLRRTRQQALFDLEVLEAELVQSDSGGIEYSEDEAQIEIMRQKRGDIEYDLRTKRSELALAEQTLEAKNGEANRYEKLRTESLEAQPHYRELHRQVTEAKKNLAELWNGVHRLDKIIEFDAKDQGIQFKTMSLAGTTRRPKLPKSGTIVLLALGVGLAFGACSVFLREFFDHSFHTANSVSHALGLQILEGIDEILLPADRRRALLRRLVLVPLGCVFLIMVATSGGLAYLSLEDPPLFNKIVAKATSTWSELGFAG